MVERLPTTSLPDASKKMLNQPLSISGCRAESIDLRMHEPMILSFGEYHSRPSGWLELAVLYGDRNVVGYGEGATLPEAAFTDDSGHTIAPAMKTLVDEIALRGGTVREALEMNQTHVFSDATYPTARLAVEMAILDCVSKANDCSMADFIGLPRAMHSVPYGKSIGGDTQESILRQTEAALELKAKKIKIKVSPSNHHQVIYAILEIQSSHPQVEIMVDANGSFDPLNEDHVTALATLDSLGLIMIEEPVSRAGDLRSLEAVSALRRALPLLRTPICLDDCLKTYDDCLAALNGNLADVINIKPGRIGSFLKSLELVDIAKSLEKQVMAGGMLEATPGRYMTTLLGAFCLSRGLMIPGDLSLAQERLSDDLVGRDKQLTLAENGEIQLVRTIGWGF